MHKLQCCRFPWAFNEWCYIVCSKNMRTVLKLGLYPIEKLRFKVNILCLSIFGISAVSYFCHSNLLTRLAPTKKKKCKISSTLHYVLLRFQCCVVSSLYTLWIIIICIPVFHARFPFTFIYILNTQFIWICNFDVCECFASTSLTNLTFTYVGVFYLCYFFPFFVLSSSSKFQKSHETK